MLNKRAVFHFIKSIRSYSYFVMEQTTTKYRFLITGGGGYVGFHIGLRLAELKHDVLLCDINYPLPEWDRQITVESKKSTDELIHEINTSFGLMKFSQGDIRNEEFLLSITHNIDCVIHTASFGMSGREQMPPYWDKSEDVNINGTRNVIETCYRNGVRGLVYTSTYNVVFGGDVIINGNESLPYYPLHRHVDHYSKTKSIAEQLVLISNGKGNLRTCALRLAGVIGRGEKRHLSRIITAIRSGWVRFNYFDQHGGLVDFIGIDNVVQGHVKAALKLCEPDSKIGGNAYFICDGKPVNNLEYFRPLMDHFEAPFPTICLPLWLMYILVFAVHFLYNCVYKFVNFMPFLTPAELYKTGVTHYFNIDKARRDFDYNPTKPNDLSDIFKDYPKPHI